VTARLIGLYCVDIESNDTGKPIMNNTENNLNYALNKAYRAEQERRAAEHRLIQDTTQSGITGKGKGVTSASGLLSVIANLWR